MVSKFGDDNFVIGN
jgi:hypothetical protein